MASQIHDATSNPPLSAGGSRGAGRRQRCRGRTAADAGTGRRYPSILPRRLPVALRERADRRLGCPAMPAEQSREPVASLPKRGKSRERFDRREESGCCPFISSCLPGDHQTTLGSADEHAPAGNGDAPGVRYRLPTVVSGCPARWRPGACMPCRSPRKPVRAVPRGTEPHVRKIRQTYSAASRCRSTTTLGNSSAVNVSCASNEAAPSSSAVRLSWRIATARARAASRCARTATSISCAV